MLHALIVRCTLRYVKSYCVMRTKAAWLGRQSRRQGPRGPRLFDRQSPTRAYQVNPAIHGRRALSAGSRLRKPKKPNQPPEAEVNWVNSEGGDLVYGDRDRHEHRPWPAPYLPTHPPTCAFCGVADWHVAMTLADGRKAHVGCALSKLIRTKPTRANHKTHSDRTHRWPIGHQLPRSWSAPTEWSGFSVSA
jgi:hypothetical protein